LIRDFASADAEQQLIDCDLCVAGAGAAGIALALEFMNRRERVVVLESGGLEYEKATQKLYAGRSDLGTSYFPLETARVRVFGGSTNHWGGMCTRFDPIDFAKRDWVPHSGWPIDYRDLDPYYERAHVLLELGEYDYDRAKIVPPGTEFLPFGEDRIRQKMWRYSMPPIDFGAAYRSQLAEADNIDVLLHANLTEIETTDNAGEVTAFKIATLDGRSARIRARTYVLALGGIETARMLLCNDHVISAGLGNQHDLVGRFFMEHLGILPAEVLDLRQDGWQRAYDDLFRGDRQVRCGLTASFEAQEQEEILNSMLMFGQRNVERQSDGYRSLAEIRKQVTQGEFPEDLGEHLYNIITDLDGLVRGLYEKVDSSVFIGMEAEQSPNPDSRVVLGTERDQLGLRRPSLDWRPNELDRRSVRKLLELTAQELGRMDVGRLKIEEWVMADDWGKNVRGHFHHMGTTRMASEPSQGVVNADCQLFGTDNLYVAGSSVFPTGGCANPTLTLVALTLRLADHLQGRLDKA
jgi:choline dehydrogenase-like flavoprotein